MGATEILCPAGSPGELHQSPHFGPVHVHHALRRPDPVVLRHPRHFLIGAVGVRDLPFHAREVNAPLFAFIRRPGMTRIFSEHFPREGDFNRPTLVRVAGMIERAVDVDGGFHAGDFPGIVRLALIHVGLVEPQIPRGVERVHLEFVIRLRVARRVHEHLEIRVLENHRVMVRERGPDIRLLKFGGDVEVMVVPEHFHARAKARFWFGVALDVHEILRPGRGRPRGVIQHRVYIDWRERALAQITARGNGLHSFQPVGATFGEQRGRQKREADKQSQRIEKRTRAQTELALVFHRFSLVPHSLLDRRPI